MKTTLNQIREHSPCHSGWEKLLRTLGKTKADNEPVSIVQVLDSNGLDDALWCLRAVKGHDREIRLYAVWCARQVQHLMTDQRSVAALDVAERFANGEATSEELESAAWSAWAAESARSAAESARSAAESAWAAESARSAAESARSAAESARSAAESAAGSAAGSAESAAWAAESARSARSAAGSAQEKELRRLCASIEVREP